MISQDKEIYISDDNGDILEFNSMTLNKYILEICKKMKLMHLDIDKIVNNVYPKLKNINTANDINEIIIMSATEMICDHYDYQYIATYLLIKKLHENTFSDYLKIIEQMETNINKKGKRSPIVSKGFANYVKKHYNEINKVIDYERDYEITVFSYRTLERSYLKKTVDGKIIERPQHMYMRVAIAIHWRSDRLDLIFKTYDLLSKGYYSHATPTLFNAGAINEQLSSCFLLGVDDDMESIGNCWKDCAVISKYAGGIGINVTNIRTIGSYINSTQGTASGLKMLTVFNQIVRIADQCGKRNGSIAIYVEPWHGDIFYFLDLKKNTGIETDRARDLFTALMINDIFMERVENDEVWSLMCPLECPDLLNKYGEEFTKIYIKYENEKKYLKQIKARDLWFKIMETQIETGIPYIIFKDAANKKSNQKNIGVINGSNLCAEILEYSSANEYAVCNLASICLPKYIKMINNELIFDYMKLFEVTKIITHNLNNIIDINFYPVKKTKKSNLKHRPIGIGVQGLADVFAIFKVSYDSDIARDLNKKIFETIYFGAMTESMNLAKQYGPYSTYQGSPISEGKFQFDLWNLNKSKLSGMWDWDKLRKEILKYGVRNSLTTTCMPTATTSQIQGNNESVEAYTSAIYIRSTLAGEYYIINKYLMMDLIKENLWNNDIIDMIKFFDGSIQKIPSIPDRLKKIYRTVWEIDQMSLIEMSADRAPFIDQTQSLNIFINKPDFTRLNTCLFYAWEKGLKTGMYYLRSKTASDPSKFGMDIEKIKEMEKKFGSNDDNVINISINIKNCNACSS